jgi:hypothetical protein
MSKNVKTPSAVSLQPTLVTVMEQRVWRLGYPRGCHQIACECNDDPIITGSHMVLLVSWKSQVEDSAQRNLECFSTSKNELSIRSNTLGSHIPGIAQQRRRIVPMDNKADEESGSPAETEYRMINSGSRVSYLMPKTTKMPSRLFFYANKPI